MRKTVLLLALVLGLAASVRAADYFPLAKGNNWHYTCSYNVYGTTMTVDLKMGIIDETVTGPDSIFTMKVSAVYTGMQDSSTGHLQSKENSILSLDTLPPPGSTYFKDFEHSPRVGDTWTNEDGQTWTVEYIGRTTVVAGTFDSCYAAVNATGGEVQIYAPNVGMVDDRQDTTMHIELVGYGVQVPGPVIRPPHQTRGTQAAAGGLSPGLYSLLNAEGRCIDMVTVGTNGRPDRALAPGTYFLLEKAPVAPGIKRSVKRCVIGK